MVKGVQTGPVTTEVLHAECWPWIAPCEDLAKEIRMQGNKERKSSQDLKKTRGINAKSGRATELRKLFRKTLSH